MKYLFQLHKLHLAPKSQRQQSFFQGCCGVLFCFISLRSNKLFISKHSKTFVINKSDYEPERCDSILLDDKEKNKRFLKVATSL